MTFCYGNSSNLLWLFNNNFLHVETPYKSKGNRVKKALQNSSCEIVMLEELHWWSTFLCRKLVYGNWLHLIKITVGTVHSVIG